MGESTCQKTWEYAFIKEKGKREKGKDKREKTKGKRQKGKDKREKAKGKRQKTKGRREKVKSCNKSEDQ